MQHDELDPDLQRIFAQNAPNPKDESFVAMTMARVEALRRRELLARRALQALGLVGVAIVSPALIAGAEWLTRALDLVFTPANTALSTPAGSIVAIVASIAILLLSRTSVLGRRRR